MKLEQAQFQQLFCALPADKAAQYLAPFQAALDRFEITTPLRIAAYAAQIGHESNDLTRWLENLNYSAVRLRKVWPKWFPTMTIAMEYANNPQKLANYVYANRMGNDDNGDGWKYRGRGPLQATGREMYAWLTKQFGVDYLSNPDLIVTPEHGFLAAAAIYAVRKSGNVLADRGKEAAFTLLTERINGGHNGLEERLERYRRARKLLGA